jgi:RimJ/RimL family protein N-acetyltransferase
MEHLVPAGQLDRYRSYFPGPHLELVQVSIAAGNTAGHLWIVPQIGGSSLLLLWDKGNNALYLAGDVQAPSSLGHLAAIVATDLRAQMLAMGRRQFKARALSASLEHALPQVFADIALCEYPELFYIYDTARTLTHVVPPRLPEVSIVPITHDLLAQSDLAGSGDVRAEIRWMWPSEDRFFTDGFGTLAITDRQIICWCTSEYVSPRLCGIGIATLPPYERHGVATATATRFVQEAQRRGLTVCWECGRENQGSVRVAEKVGFVRWAEEQYWIGSFSE